MRNFKFQPGNERVKVLNPKDLTSNATALVALGHKVDKLHIVGSRSYLAVEIGVAVNLSGSLNKLFHKEF